MWYDYNAPATCSDLYIDCVTVGYSSSMMDELIGYLINLALLGCAIVDKTIRLSYHLNILVMCVSLYLDINLRLQ